MPDQPTANPKQFIQCAPVLHVADVEATTCYYSDVLGFACDYGDENYSVVCRDNSAIHFVKDTQSPSGVHLFQWVRDVDAYYQEIVDRGAQISLRPTDQPYGLREMAITDLNGVRIVFGQEIEAE